MLLFYIVCCFFDLVSYGVFLVVKVVLPNIDLHSNNYVILGTLLQYRGYKLGANSVSRSNTDVV